VTSFQASSPVSRSGVRLQFLITRAARFRERSRKSVVGLFAAVRGERVIEERGSRHMNR